VVHRQLTDYTEKLVRQRGLDLTIDEINVACRMLQGALFADAMGRDIMPDMYPTLRRAAEGYARMFLSMLGAEDEPASADSAAGREGKDNGTKNRRRSPAGTRQRNGQGRQRPSGT
jgi:hypothetical protein